MALYGVRAHGAQDALVDRIESWWNNTARPVVQLPYASAAIAKAALNAYLTQQIVFGGILHHLVKRFGESPAAVIDAMACDRRFNRAYMKGMMPFGGPCFPKDLDAFTTAVDEADFPATFLRATRESNEIMARRIAYDILTTGAERIGLVGVAYKGGTTVVEHAPAVAIAGELQRASPSTPTRKGVECRWWDPLVTAPPDGLGPRTPQDELWEWADCLVLLHGSFYGAEPPERTTIYDPWS